MDWNPSSALKRLAADVVDEKFLTVAQTRWVLSHVSGYRMIARWTLVLLTGCRQGGALGLERSRVNLTPGAETVDLSWQLQRLVWTHGDRCLDAKTGRRASVNAGSIARHARSQSRTVLRCEAYPEVLSSLDRRQERQTGVCPELSLYFL